MKRFTYYDNNSRTYFKSSHGELLIEIIAKDILEADKVFIQKLKFNPICKPPIGVTVEIMPWYEHRWLDFLSIIDKLKT